MGKVGTIMVHGSGGEVMAPVGNPGMFFRGKCMPIRITAVGNDQDVPIAVRQALVGMNVEAMFTKESFERQTGIKLAEAPAGSLLGYVQNIIEDLNSAGKSEAAAALKKVMSNVLDLYVFEPGTFEPINS